MTTQAYDLINSLVPRLQAILVANGYATNAGTSVAFGPVPRRDGETMPFVRLLEAEAEQESQVPNRPKAKVRVYFIAEGHAEQSTAASIMSTGHALVGDLKRADRKSVV